MFSSSGVAGTAEHMDRLYLGYPNDAEVDALLSQLNDEALLKLKVNTHKTSSNGGFEYPTFTDGWSSADDNAALEDLDTQLASRFSSLKRPIVSAKKKGKDSFTVGKKGSNSETVVGKKSRDSVVVGKKCEDGDKSGKSIKSSAGEEDGSSNRRKPHKRELSTIPSQKTEFLSFRSSDEPAAAEDEDPDSIDALLKDRFLALKAPRRPTPAPTSRNVGLDNLLQFSGQLASVDYEGYGSSLSTPSSPSANLLGRSKSRSSPRVLTTSVATSCHCSAPSPLKLLKNVGSKSFSSTHQPSPGTLPSLSPAAGTPAGNISVTTTTPAKEGGRDYKVEGFGNSKPVTKESEKTKKNENKEKQNKNEKEKKSSNEDNNSSPSTVKEMRKLLSSVADRVGFERSRVSSAVEDDFLGEDSHSWSVLGGEQEFAKAFTDEKELNREADRVVEWAKDAARLETDESDLDTDAGDLEPGDVDDDQDSGESFSSEKSSDKEKPKTNGIGAAPRKKRWGLF